ncbi:hypothetical protein GCM10027048_00270 [Hymenobacter coalescens]
MEYTADLSTVRWLNPAYYFGPADEPLKVKHLIPVAYEQYLTLLPVVGIIADFPFGEVQPDSTAIDQINRNVAIWTQHGVYISDRTPHYQSTTFRQLAARFELPYDMSLVNRLPWGRRGFAILEEPSAARLRTLLNGLAAATKLNLYVEDYWRWGPQMHHVLPTDDEVLYRVTADEFVTFLQQAMFDATAYLFPDDRSWCLVNVEDGLAPIIGLSSVAQTRMVMPAHVETMLLNPESEVF